MRARLAAAGIVVCAMLAGCAGSPKPAEIKVSPAQVSTNGPVVIKATVKNTLTTPSWTLSGPGTLSDADGFQVTYRPPSPVGATTSATITASVDGVSATVSITIQPTATSATPTKIPGLSATATVLYDAYDIPHIQCAQAIDCFAVYGWVQAHDRLFQMDLLRRTARGKVAELVGPLGLSQDVQLRTLFTTRDGQRLEDAVAASADADTTAKVASYVKGVNAYLADLRSAGTKLVMPGEYAQLAYPVTANDIPDWTLQDVFGLARLFQFQLSFDFDSDFGTFALAYGPGAPHEDAGKMRAWALRSAPPPLMNTHTLPVAPPRGGASDFREQLAVTFPDLQGWAGPLAAAHRDFGTVREALKPLNQPFGSNNWVVDAAHSASGKAMVANDPHLSLQYPPNFHLFTMTSSNAADNMDIAGGAFPGAPIAEVGRGKNVAWGVTVVGYDVTDMYLEQIVPPTSVLPGGTCPTAAAAGCAVFKGGPVPVRVYPQSFKIRTSAGLVDAVTAGALTQAQSVVAMIPHHGPIVSLDSTTGKAVTVRWTGQEGHTNPVKAFLGLNVATDVDSAIAALATFDTGAQNFVLADDKGNIAYDPHALVPIRNFADPTKVGANLRPPWFPLPGDGTAEWGTGNAADHCAGTTAAGDTPPARACWVADADPAKPATWGTTALPFGKNPAKGFYATANADPIGISDDRPAAFPIPAPFPDAAAGPAGHGWSNYLSFNWDDSTGFRHARITQLLGGLIGAAGTGKVALSDMQAVQSDHYSLIGKAFNTVVQAIPDAAVPAANLADFKAAKGLLASWTYDCPTGLTGTDPASAVDPDPTRSNDSAACYLFHAFFRTLMFNVFADDLAVAGIGLNGVQAIKAIFYMLSPSTPASDTTFCNDVDYRGATVKTHSCGEQVVIALITAYDLLLAQKGAPANWRWGRVHTMQPVSQFPAVTDGYEPGPYARPGGAFTVDVGTPSFFSSSLASFAFGSSGNVRHISVMDAATPVLKMQLPGPERDVTTSNLYGPNLLGMWVANAYLDLPYQASVAPAAVSQQAFAAQ